jgi:hypothetical protein
MAPSSYSKTYSYSQTNTVRFTESQMNNKKFAVKIHPLTLALSPPQGREGSILMRGGDKISLS